MQDKTHMVSKQDALAGRSQSMLAPDCVHAINRRALSAGYPEGAECILFGMGCFWGAEKCFWSLPGVWVTAVGYSGGFTPNPDYEEVCSGMTGHNEVVLVVYRPEEIEIDDLLQVFWQQHNPTQGMRQGNDVGTQYRSAIYYQNSRQQQRALASRQIYDRDLSASGFMPVTTEICAAAEFYFAEQWHQQYLHKNPMGYCGLGGTGVSLSPV